MPDIGASGILGVAIEVTSGTYLAPVKFVPFNSESIKYNINAVERRPVRATAGLVGLIPGNSTVEGDIEFDFTADVFAHFMYASRMTVVKSGAGPYIYTGTPSANAVPVKTLSISIKRGTEVFGYVGCVVTGFTIAIGDDGKMTCTVSILGRTEASAAALTAVWPTAPVFQSGMYSLQIPTATQVFDADTFEFSVEDNGSANGRIKSTVGAAFVSFGESNASIKTARDFATRADYDTYKAGTAQSITLLATADASNILSILAPVSVKNSYEVNIGGQGDLVRASIEYNCVIDATGKHYQVVCTTAESIV